MTRRPSRLSLLQLLTVPFLVLVLLLCATVGALSYRAARAAVDETALLWLQSTVRHLGDELQRQSEQADAVLDVAQPPGTAVPSEWLSTSPDVVRDRLWAALSAHRDVHAEVSWVDAEGCEATVRRRGPAEAEWLLRDAQGKVMASQLLRSGTEGWQPTQFADAPGGATRKSWYAIGKDATSPIWTAVDLQPDAPALQLHRVRAVVGEGGARVGVLATPVRLKVLDDSLRQLQLSPRAVAFVVERDGRLVAASQAAVLRRGAEGVFERVSAADAGSPVMAAAYLQLLPHLGASSLARPGLRVLEPPDSEALLVGFGRIAQGPMHDWAVVVAAPRADFTAGLIANVAHTAAVGLVTAAMILILGAWVRRRLTRDVRALAQTAAQVGDGDLDNPPPPMASAELEALGDSLRRMQLRLRTDRITGLANREAVLTRLHDRMRPGRRQNDAPLVALLFVDLDRFKSINERHGHEAGDFVLLTLGRRLRQTVRDTDLVARWAGDEFVLLLDSVSSEESAQQVRDQVERVLRDPIELGPGRDAAELGGTVGLAIYPADAQDPDALLHAAEDDMLLRKPASVSQW